MARRRVERPEELATKLQHALAEGDHATALALARELEQQLRRATKSTEAATEPTGTDAVSFAAAPAVMHVARAPRAAGSTRRTVASALAEIGVPARAKLIADYAQARFSERVEPRAFAALRRDERRTWRSTSPRPSYVVPALEGRFFHPIRGVLALSEWPLERRILGPWSERVDHLVATAQLARQLAWLASRDPATSERLAPVVASMARSIPGALEGDELDTGRVEAAADEERRALAERDEPWREDAAARAREQLDDEQQLWGSQIAAVAGGKQ